jgi:hypothetical protein
MAGLTFVVDRVYCVARSGFILAGVWFGLLFPAIPIVLGTLVVRISVSVVGVILAWCLI